MFSAEQLRSLPGRFHASQVVLAHGEGHGMPSLHKHRLLAADAKAFFASAAAPRCRAAALLTADAAIEARQTAQLEAAAPTDARFSGDAFIWRMVVERQRRWYRHAADGVTPLRDAKNRFVPTAANPLPQLSPQDKLMERSYLTTLGVRQTKLLGTCEDAAQLRTLLASPTLPASFAIKPVGAAASVGVTLVREGVVVTDCDGASGGDSGGGGLPLHLPTLVAQYEALWRANGGAASLSDATPNADTNGAVAASGGGRAASAAAVAAPVTHNLSRLLVEELVSDEGRRCPPTDYRFFVVGGEILWVWLVWDSSDSVTSDGGGVPARQLATRTNATVNEHFVLQPSALERSSGGYAAGAGTAWHFCTDAASLVGKPCCWDAMVKQARALGGKLGVFARLDWYADAVHGPLLGEVTLTPNLNDPPSLFSVSANRRVQQSWHGLDGCDDSPAPSGGGGAAAAVPGSTHEGIEKLRQPPVLPSEEAVRFRGTTLPQIVDEASRSTSSGSGRGQLSSIDGWETAALLAQLEAFDLSPWSVAHGERVALLLPQPGGARTAVALLAAMGRYCALPLQPTAPVAMLTSWLAQLRARCLVVCAAGDGGGNNGVGGDLERRGALAAAAASVPLIVLHDATRLARASDRPGAFVLRPPPSMPATAAPATVATISGRGFDLSRASLFGEISSLAPAWQHSPSTPSGLDRTVLVLTTSGTTGDSKPVPYTLRRLLSSGIAVAESLRLSELDVCLNVMPLHHVGGVVCSLMAPLVSRSRCAFADTFDEEDWFMQMKAAAATWFYATPAIFARILAVGATPEEPLPSLRLLRSGGAPLSHSDALRLSARFRCAVLPTYSMSECMPIASPPPDYDLSSPGSVGPPLGVEVRIVGAASDGCGEIALRSAATAVMNGSAAGGGEQRHLLFDGYEAAAENDEGVMAGGEGNEELGGKLSEDGWFLTGDVGRLDACGWLWVTGRVRETINRGGELIAPLQVEQALAAFLPEDARVMAFAAPHDQLGEVVCIALQLPQLAELPQLRSWLGRSLPSTALPQLVVHVPSLPTTPATGKLRRVGYAASLALPALIGSQLRSFVLEPNALPAERLREVRLTSTSSAAAAASAKPSPAAAAAAVAAAAAALDGSGRAGSTDRLQQAIVELARSLPAVDEAIDATSRLEASGLDSLSAVDLAMQLRRALDLPIPLSAAYEFPSAAALATLVRELRVARGERVRALPAASPVENGGTQQLRTTTDGNQGEAVELEQMALGKPPDPLATAPPRLPSSRRRRKPRVLMLHGMASSSRLQRLLMERLGWADLLELDYLAAPHRCAPMPELYAPLVAAGLYGEQWYATWRLEDAELTAASVRAARNALARGCRRTGGRRGNAVFGGDQEDDVHEDGDEGNRLPFDGIAGICDGATIAALVKLEVPPPRHRPFFFLNFCGGPLSSCDGYVLERDLGERCDDSEATPRVEVRHAGGHAVPLLLPEIEDIVVPFLARVMGGGAGADGGGQPPRKHTTAAPVSVFDDGDDHDADKSALCGTRQCFPPARRALQCSWWRIVGIAVFLVAEAFLVADVASGHGAAVPMPMTDAERIAAGADGGNVGSFGGGGMGDASFIKHGAGGAHHGSAIPISRNRTITRKDNHHAQTKQKAVLPPAPPHPPPPRQRGKASNDTANRSVRAAANQSRVNVPGGHARGGHRPEAGSAP